MIASIIIRTYNEERYLSELLNAIEDQDFPRNDREIIVVDSGSTDETLQIIARHDVKLIHIKKNEFSFGRSLNRGIENSNGKFAVMISGHCVPENETWLSMLIAGFQNDASVAITYGRQLAGPATSLSEAQIFDKYFPASGNNGQKPYFCNNANSAIRKEVWQQYKYDEELTGLEDMHLAKKACADGLSVAYVPSASVYHYHHETWRQVRTRFEREAMALREIMPELHLSAWDAARYFVAGVLKDSGTALAKKKFIRNFLSICGYRFCQYYGVWKGNHMHRQFSAKDKDRYFYPR